MKKISVFILLLLLVNRSSTLCFAGNEGVGGGSPIAAEFVDISQKISKFISSNKAYFSELNHKKITYISTKLFSSLNTRGAKSLVKVSTIALFDRDGTPKIALYNRNELSVTINRDSWLALKNDNRKKIELVSMELLGLSGHNHMRYKIARDKLGKNYYKVLMSSYKLEKCAEFSTIMRLRLSNYESNLQDYIHSLQYICSSVRRLHSGASYYGSMNDIYQGIQSSKTQAKKRLTSIKVEIKNTQKLLEECNKYCIYPNSEPAITCRAIVRTLVKPSFENSIDKCEDIQTNTMWSELKN